jgi:large subunit ribosomal protein L6
MSRIGKEAVVVPSGVDVNISGLSVTIKGPKGTLTRNFPVGVSITHADNNITVTRDNDERDSRARHGLVRTLVSNMVIGVTDGYSKELEIIGVGYRAEAQSQVAANIREIRKPEPYKGKGVRYLGERVLRKAGKTGKK